MRGGGGFSRGIIGKSLNFRNYNVLGRSNGWTNGMLNSRSRIEIEMLLGIDWWNQYLIILPSANIISQTNEELNILTIRLITKCGAMSQKAH